jgi:hypothetical protein
MNEFMDELFKDGEQIEKDCMQTTIEPFCSRISNLYLNYVIIADRARGKCHYWEMINGNRRRFISASLKSTFVPIFKDERMVERTTNALNKVKSTERPYDDKYESDNIDKKIITASMLCQSTYKAKQNGEINENISNLLEKKTLKKGKQLVKYTK